MKNRINKIVLGTLTLAVAATMFASCTKNNGLTDSSTTPRIQSTARLAPTSQLNNDINAISDAHNNFLTAVFPLMPICSDSASFALGVETLRSQLSSDFATEAGYGDAIEFANRCSTIVTAQAEVAALEAAAMGDPTYGNAVNSLGQAVQTATDQMDLENKVLAIYSTEVTANPSAATGLKNLCGVTIGSYEYWNNHIDPWINLHNPTEANPTHAAQTKKEKVRDFVLADIGGAAFGVPIAVIASGIVAWSWD